MFIFPEEINDTFIVEAYTVPVLTNELAPSVCTYPCTWQEEAENEETDRELATIQELVCKLFVCMLLVVRLPFAF